MSESLCDKMIIGIHQIHVSKWDKYRIALPSHKKVQFVGYRWIDSGSTLMATSPNMAMPVMNTYIINPQYLKLHANAKTFRSDKHSKISICTQSFHSPIYSMDI